MDQLYINDVLVDLAKSTNIVLSKQSNDISDLMSRQGDFSNEYSLPYTDTNKEVYENCHIIYSDSEVPYRKAKARLVKNGIEIVPNGYAILNDTDNNGYNVQVLSGNMDFFKTIEGKKMSDLDLSEYDHTWNSATIIDSFSNTEGYIYSIIDWSEDDTYMNTPDRNVNVKGLLPCFFHHTLIKKIVEEAGYTLHGNIIDTDKYKKRLMPYPLDKMEYQDAFVNSKKLKVGSLNNKYLIQRTFASSSDNKTVIYGVSFDNETQPSFYDNADAYAAGVWVVPASGKYDVTCKIKVKASTSTLVKVCFGYIKLRSFKNGVQTNVVTSNYTQADLAAGVDEFVTITQSGVVLQKGDLITFTTESNFRYNDINGVAPFGFSMITTTESYLEVAIKKEIVFNGDLYASALMPSNLSQTEFIKAMMNQLCLIPTTNSNEKKFYLNSFEIVRENISKAIDISEYIDVSLKPKISYRIGSYAQKNIIQWNNDDKITDETLGEGYFTIDDETLPNEKVIIKLTYSATIDIERLDGLMICNIPKFIAGVMKNKTNIRCIMLNQKTISPGISFYEDLSFISTKTVVPLTYFEDVTKLDSLSGNYLIQDNYRLIKDILNKTKVVSVTCKIPIDVFNNFDNTIPFFVKQYSNYFYVNIIENYNKNLCTVELIRI
mgnify:CR=1 FL=1